jgi:hypothetical protein
MPLIAKKTSQCAVHTTDDSSVCGDVTTVALLGGIPIDLSYCEDLVGRDFERYLLGGLSRIV